MKKTGQRSASGKEMEQTTQKVKNNLIVFSVEYTITLHFSHFDSKSKSRGDHTGVFGRPVPAVAILARSRGDVNARSKRALVVMSHMSHVPKRAVQHSIYAPSHEVSPPLLGGCDSDHHQWWLTWGSTGWHVFHSNPGLARPQSTGSAFSRTHVK